MKSISIGDTVRVVQLDSNGSGDDSFERFMGLYGEVTAISKEDQYPITVRFKELGVYEAFKVTELSLLEREKITVEGVVQLKITNNLLKVKNGLNKFVVKGYNKPINVGDIIKVSGILYDKNLVKVI